MPKLAQKQIQKQTLSPRQIMQATMLQKTTADLEAAILEEIESNPVLEQVEKESEEKPKSEEENEEELDWNVDMDDYEPVYVPPRKERTQELPIPERPDFIEGLIKQLELFGLSESDRMIAEEIIWNLDERGYLSIDPLLIADRLETTEEKLESVLRKVQQLDPKGIAARNLRECLLIQLSLETSSLAYKVIDGYFEDFANHRYEHIYTSLGCTDSELAEVIEQISHLNPAPGETRTVTRDETVIPDVVAVKREGRWTVFVNDNWMPELQISTAYAEMAGQKNQSKETRKFIGQKLESANWFIQAIQQRRKTLIRVTETIINRQPEFFSGQVTHQRPMKLQDVAEEIEMDISTVSRATRGKYVDTPFGVFELKSFFSEGIELESGDEVSTTRIKQALKNLVDQEDKTRPLTDELLMNLLKKAGFPVARRTVAKYRDLLKIPTARLRRQIVK